MVAESGVWLYAVTSDVAPYQLAGTTGVDGEPVRTVDAAGLVAIVGSVRMEEFGEEPLRRKLNDLASLEAVARAHHRVVDASAHLTAVVPARVATVYRADASVAAMLVDQRDQLTAALDRIAGRTELGVKAYAAGRPATGAGDGSPASAGGSPGTAYLMRRRAQLSAAEEGRRAAIAAAEDVHAALSRLAAAVHRHAPQDSQLSGQAGWMVLNGAYLVERQRVGEFTDAVRALADQHPAVRLEVTGPWPPYSFTTEPDGPP